MTTSVQSPLRDSPAAAGANRAFDAVIFDMDGVVTDTAAIHATAWKRMFDEYLRRREREHGEAFHEFTQGGDYRAHVDGRPRYVGVAAFLLARGIHLPAGSPTDAPEAETICGLGNRKNELFNRMIVQDGVKSYASTLALIRALGVAGRRVGLATSSRNAGTILGRTGVAAHFATVVDGVEAERRGLRGKPQPDIFVAAAADLGAAPDRAIVVEDAVAGVQAGVAGGFALVIGVARENNAAALHEAGAHLVVPDLAGLDPAGLDMKVRLRGASR